MSISVESFTKAITTLDRTWKSLETSTEWDDVAVAKQLQVGAVPFLRIHRRLNPRFSSTQHSQEAAPQFDEPILEELDPESLLSPSTASSPTQGQLVTYEIIHSPTYLVPVLYLYLAPSKLSSHSQIAPQPAMEELYDLLVPAAYRSQLDSVGPMGALSRTEHPLRGFVCWFVHPCLTQEAMTGMMGSDESEKEGEWKGREMEYLMKWFGIVGGSVGLRVPVEVARAIDSGIANEALSRASRRTENTQIRP
ncbi:unnamed protein product [Zymoseptoria tritici ST99CH_3D1]|uniref:Ubiquitin-like-conjugating enzyme ATG10 n=1 Tax=Zymoseptoria tritici ST99CH_1E4 TaxID=1276532 RepID=A0A2H1GNS8_ZYMTR|nr:unnamed protein product [Zymoseptoria tritici ST99CH_1E4]SMR57592.1 unnamed protein product [Zymoseptoria tritici ST99CH_3D1]